MKTALHIYHFVHCRLPVTQWADPIRPHPFLFPVAQQPPQTHSAEQPHPPREHLLSWPSRAIPVRSREAQLFINLTFITWRFFLYSTSCSLQFYQIKCSFPQCPAFSSGLPPTSRCPHPPGGFSWDSNRKRGDSSCAKPVALGRARLAGRAEGVLSSPPFISAAISEREERWWCFSTWKCINFYPYFLCCQVRPRQSQFIISIQSPQMVNKW